MSSKRFSFNIPKWKYEKFLRLFPGNGERTAFLNHMIDLALYLGEDSRLINKIKRMCEKGDC